jgi:hypothetical protein
LRAPAPPVLYCVKSIFCSPSRWIYPGQAGGAIQRLRPTNAAVLVNIEWLFVVNKVVIIATTWQNDALQRT